MPQYDALLYPTNQSKTPIKSMKKLIFLFLSITLLCACKNGNTAVTDAEPQLLGPVFNEDSALAFCAKQCEFGPRNMNTEAHEQCAQWIIDKFKEYGCEVSTQKVDIKGWDGTMLHSTNIIASINPTATQRILFCAHWDSRPWADNDPDESNHHTPIIAANDAASGVGVMLEMARVIHPDSIAIGIDFVCFDAEDYGAPSWSGIDDENSWALGAQYFALKYKEKEMNMFANSEWQAAVLLDMVGGQNAKFHQEGLSKHYAQSIIDDVWQAASDAGYGSFFPYSTGGYITDDHKPLNEAGIPTIDIIPYYPDCEASAFGPTWHTISDDMNHLDKGTLKAVGQTLIQYLFSIQ